MRIALCVSAAALTISLAPAFAAPASTSVDFYAFAGGPEATATAPLQTGRSAAVDNAAPKAFTKDDIAHAFAPRGFAD